MDDWGKLLGDTAAVGERRFIPEELREPFAQFEPNGSLSDPLLQYFEATGDFMSMRPEAPG